MSTDARAALELSKEGRHFLDLVAKCSDSQLGTALISAGAKLLTVAASGKENALPGPAAPDSTGFTAALLFLKGLSFINPRGRFDMSFSRESLCLANAKGSIIVPTKLLTHVAILDQIPQDTRKRCLLFLVLDRSGPPIMNGKQRLEVVIIQTLESDNLSATASSGEALEGPMAAVVCQALGMCIPNFANFLAPDPDVYKSARGHVAVPAVVKVNAGHLFPLPGAVLFAERPAIFIPHSDILAVEYRRPQSATFDLVLHVRGTGVEGGQGGGEAAAGSGGGGGVQVVEFSQVDRGELGRLQSYFATSKIKLYDPSAPPRPGGGGSGGPAAAAARASGAVAGGSSGIGDDDDDEEDEDEDDEDFDPTSLQRLESRRRLAKRLRTETPGSAAGSSLPGGSGAGPSGSRDACRTRMKAEEVDVDDESDEDDEDDDEDDEDEDEDDEDELADLTDEDDLRADDVRQRVGRGGGGPAAATAAAAKGKGSPPTRKRGREEEEEEEDYEDDEE